MGQIYSLLINDSSCTKRELFYKKQDLFEEQTQSDAALNDISTFLGCPLWRLGINSSSKGLIAGHLIISYEDNIISSHTDKTIIVPYELSNMQSLSTEAKFILIVEKDTVFQRLIDDNIFNKFKNELLLITVSGLFLL